MEPINKLISLVLGGALLLGATACLPMAIWKLVSVALQITLVQDLRPGELISIHTTNDH